MEKKKMTKAEAFEYLKHRKVSVVGDTCTIQNKLFEIGYTWCDGTIKVIPMVDLLLIDDETFQFTESLSHFKNCAYEEISADGILSIEIVKDTKPECERNEHVKALQELIAKSGCIDCIIISKNDIGILKK